MIYLTKIINTLNEQYSTQKSYFDYMHYLIAFYKLIYANS